MPRDRRSSPNRSALGYWMPLVMTVTVATIGIAAWVWKERNDNDEPDDGWDYGYNGRGDRPPSTSQAPDYSSQPPAGHTGYATGAEPNAPPPSSISREDDPNVFARMQGALRRTPSPQQILDGASRKVAAGVAAAGAMVGGALGSIREENQDHHYADHNRWSEQRATLQREHIEQVGAGMGVGGSTSAPAIPTLGAGSGYRRTVVIVISAEASSFEGESSLHTEHASLLSHLPEHIDNDTRIFILIFAPTLKQHPLAAPGSKPAPSVSSSYSHIGQEDLQTPGEESEKPLTAVDPAPVGAAGAVGATLGATGIPTSPALGPSSGATDMFRALYAQAQALATRDTMIMPFTSSTGWLAIVKHIHPDTVYVQSSLSGPGGESIKEVSRWVGQVVLVVGDDSGHGGLVDSEDEHGPHASGNGQRDTWWENDPAIGLGKGIEVVEGMRIGEDWRRRVKGHD